MCALHWINRVAARKRVILAWLASSSYWLYMMETNVEHFVEQIYYFFSQYTWCNQGRKTRPSIASRSNIIIHWLTRQPDDWVKSAKFRWLCSLRNSSFVFAHERLLRAHLPTGDVETMKNKTQTMNRFLQWNWLIFKFEWVGKQFDEYYVVSNGETPILSHILILS